MVIVIDVVVKELSDCRRSFVKSFTADQFNRLHCPKLSWCLSVRLLRHHVCVMGRLDHHVGRLVRSHDLRNAL